MERNDPGTLVGIGRLDKWRPADLEAKTRRERELIREGLSPVDAALQALLQAHGQGRGPLETIYSRNALVNTGLTDYNNGITTAGLATPYSTANAHIGVGDNNPAVAFAVTQTDLQGTNKYRQGMDATYPSVSNGVVTFRATYGTAVANFAWAEWGVFNASASGRMLNRAIASLGTKPNTQSWQLTVTITLS